MSANTLRIALLTLTLSTPLVTSVHAQHEDVVRPAAWKDLAFGGRFMDRFEPMPLLGQRTDDTWGADAVKPRDVLNGIEEAEWSYWGGNIVQGKDHTYHLRSKNGVHWKVDAGEAYMPGIALSEDGKKDDWYKYERIKMFLDEHGRAIQANFAVIDHSKWEDGPNDIHSSKNISIPLTAGRLLTLLSKERMISDTNEIRVRIAAEPGFDPHKDLKPDSLRFGAPEEVDFGRGARMLRTLPDGKDLIAVFSGKGNVSRPATLRQDKH